MKITQENSTQAPGYTNENVRTCPRCHGDGLYMGNPDGGGAKELECNICNGYGIVTLTKQEGNMENIIRNIVAGQSDGERTGVDLARHIADEHEAKTGNRCTVRRVLDYVDQFNGRDREHYSFDIVEVL